MAAAKEKVKGRPDLTICYDRPVDVLHIVLGEALPYEGDGRPLGIELDYALDTDTPVGAKVIGFKRYGWSRRVDDLAEIIADHLAIDWRDLADAIRHQTKDRKPQRKSC